MEFIRVSKSLFLGAGKQLIAQRSLNSIIKSVVFLLLAIASGVVLYLLQLDNKSALYLTLMLTAIFFTVGAIYQLFCGKKIYFLKQTHSPMRECVCYFQNGHGTQVVQAILNANWDVLQQCSVKDESGVRFELLFSEDGAFARGQVFSFSSYSYEPISDVINISGEHLKKIRFYCK